MGKVDRRWPQVRRRHRCLSSCPHPNHGEINCETPILSLLLCPSRQVSPAGWEMLGFPAVASLHFLYSYTLFHTFRTCYAGWGTERVQQQETNIRKWERKKKWQRSSRIIKKERSKRVREWKLFSVTAWCCSVAASPRDLEFWTVCFSYGTFCSVSLFMATAAELPQPPERCNLFIFVRFKLPRFP